MLENIAPFLENVPSVLHWLVLSSLLFSIGLYGLLTRRNAVGILMSVELLLNSGALNFILFNRFINSANVDGQVMGIFVIAIAAAEVVVGMAIFVALFQNRKTVDVTELNVMKG
ncbi:NADH-quinone oxidoreductase subunit NuoK [Bdellovibrionota bacterium FG-2]